MPKCPDVNTQAGRYEIALLAVLIFALFISMLYLIMNTVRSLVYFYPSSLLPLIIMSLITVGVGLLFYLLYDYCFINKVDRIINNYRYFTYFMLVMLFLNIGVIFAVIIAGLYSIPSYGIYYIITIILLVVLALIYMNILFRSSVFSQYRAFMLSILVISMGVTFFIMRFNVMGSLLTASGFIILALSLLEWRRYP